jgi:AraC-like DNA-binding protein
MVSVATTSSGWAIAIARALESRNIDPQPLFTEAGIDLEQSWDPNTRYPVTHISRLTRLATDASGDPCFGLTMGSMMRPTSWHALGFSIWASSSLREVLERVARYFKVFTTCAMVRLEEEEHSIHFIGQALPTYQPILQFEEYDAFIANLVLTCRHLKPGGFVPLAVGLPRPDSEEVRAKFEHLFKCPVAFGQPYAFIAIALVDADAPLPTANPELAQRNDQICMEYIARFDRDDIVSQVYYRLLEDLPQGEPSMNGIADAMHVSPRTLQRKLKEHQTSYKQLLDDVRRELALQYMKQPHLSVSEICYMLGFAHVSNFSRAFKRWYGASPVDFRNH